ncbi:sugar transferase [Chitinophagaceae bacterium MMS25-I14]
MLYRIFFKRMIDCSVALFGFILLSPVFVLLVFLLACANRGTPFFVQRRPGLQGHIFHVIKFKTMNDRRDMQGNLLPDAERLTSLGRFIRKTSLDEIPQLLNVILGDMSLVGPRPLLPEYMALYNQRQLTRHNVRPGITGWAQINGRNTISWTQRFEYDLWYVGNVSFVLDMKILWRTVAKVFRSEGVSSATSVTMEKFTGNYE